MSCGNHHDKDCSEVLERVFSFIDNELPTADYSEIQVHLDECGPCLQKYDLERTVKTLVARSCSERAPAALRDKVLLRIRQVQVEITEPGFDGPLPAPDVRHPHGESPWGCCHAGRLAQALGRFPWLAPFFLRARRLRPVLPMGSSWSLSTSLGPDRDGQGRSHSRIRRRA